MECYIINPAQSLLMKHLVIGQRQNAPNFSAFHWSPHGCLITIGQHFVTTRVVHLPKRTETSLNYRIGPLRSDSVIKLVLDLITESDQAVWAVHSCNSWFLLLFSYSICMKVEHCGWSAGQTGMYFIASFSRFIFEIYHTPQVTRKFFKKFSKYFVKILELGLPK